MFWSARVGAAPVSSPLVSSSRCALVVMAAAGAVALTACAAGSAGGPPAGAGTSAAASATTGVTNGGPAAGLASGSPAASSSATPHATQPGTPVPTSTALAAGGPVPAGFKATSVTFVSTDEGFVLGSAPCAHAPCTSIVRTLDRGATWTGVPAPVVPLGDPYTATATAAWGIRFASPAAGFVFGTGLWATADGGEHWAAVPGPGNPGTDISDLEVVDGQLLALAYRCSTLDGCGQSGTLYRRALAGGPWTTVTQVTGSHVIATQARVAAVADNGSVVVAGDGGLTVARHATPCDTQATETSAVAVTGPSSLALLCAGGAAMGSVQKSVYVSDNLGVTWTKAGTPSSAGDPWGISAGTAAHLTVAAASGASWLYYSADGGLQWSVAYKAVDGGAAFNDLGFTTTSDGVVVSGPLYGEPYVPAFPGKLLLTSNGGASWYAVRF